MTKQPHSLTGSTTDRTDRPDRSDPAPGERPTANIADAADLPADATVLVMPRGAFYHVPMGESKLPLCDASSVPISRITAHTRYHAAIEEGLEPCMKCLESADAVRKRMVGATHAAD